MLAAICGHTGKDPHADFCLFVICVVATTGVRKASANAKKVPQINQGPASLPNPTTNLPAPAPANLSTCTAPGAYLTAAMGAVAITKSTTPGEQYCRYRLTSADLLKRNYTRRGQTLFAIGDKPALSHLPCV